MEVESAYMNCLRKKCHQIYADNYIAFVFVGDVLNMGALLGWQGA